MLGTSNNSGDGFNALDRVEVLGAPRPIMSQLQKPDGSWRLKPVPPPYPFGGIWTEPFSVVVVDTGVRDDHPSLIGRVTEQVNLTNQELADEHGHGTAVAAILASTNPSIRIISVKALDSLGKATVERLGHAIRVSATLLNSPGVINVSAGRRTPACTGDCPLCIATLEVQREFGHHIVCAAGNDPGITYCPARSGIAVATPDTWSAEGDIISVPPQWAAIQ